MEGKISGDFYSSAMIRRMVRFWWLLPLLIVAGGLLGYLVSRVQKPLYESTAVITTVIDYAYAGRLTDFEEDHLLNAIGDVVVSDEVINAVLSQAEEEGIVAHGQLSREDLAGSRQGYRWELSVRCPDALVAQKLTRLWLDHALLALENIRQDSINAVAEFAAQEAVGACFSQAVVLEPSSAFCTVEDMQALQEHISALPQSAENESLLSRLLLSRISYQVTREPELPVTPVRLGGNLSTFAGALAGLIIGILLLVLGFPRQRSTSR